MERLSEAGRLYLESYHALERAREDLDLFLDEIIRETDNYVDDMLDELQPPVEPFEWKLDKREEWKPYVRIRARTLDEIPPFRRRKSDLTIAYYDLRHPSGTEAGTTDRGVIRIHSPNVFRQNLKRCKDEVNQSSEIVKQRFGLTLDWEGRINFRTEMRLDLDNASASAEMIGDRLMECGEAVGAFIEDLTARVAEA